MAKITEIPPWANDSHPESWVRLTLAAKYYFRKHPSYVRILACNGDIPDARKFMGEWWIRLPKDTPETLMSQMRE